MQAATSVAADDGKGNNPKRKSAYILFQQAARADMYAKFGGKDAFTANLQERHQFLSTEANQPMLGNGPVMMSAMGKMWSESPEDVKDFFRHAAQVHNADQQQQQQQHNSEKSNKPSASVSSSDSSDDDDDDDEDNAPISRLTAPAGSAPAGSATATAAAATAEADMEAQGKATTRTSREKQAARKPTPDQVQNPTAPPNHMPPPAPETTAPPAKAEAKKRSASSTAAAAAATGPSAALPEATTDDSSADGRKSRAKRDGGKSNAADAAGPAAAPAASNGGANVAGTAKRAGDKAQQPEPAKSNAGKQAKGAKESGKRSGKDGGSGQSKAFPGYLNGDDVSETSLFGLARGEKCAIDVLWEVEVQKSGQKAQMTEEWFTSSVDLTKALGEDVEGRPRFRITYARRGSLAASKSVVVFLSSNQVRDDLQDDWEDPMLWRKKGCEVAPGPGLPTPSSRPGSAGSDGVDQEAEWAEDFGVKSSRHKR